MMKPTDKKTRRVRDIRVLIACESSGVVREAFRALGHAAWSCDLLPTDDGSPYHLQEDCVKAVRGGSVFAVWDLIVMHPPCTAICVSGNRWYGIGMPKHAERIEAIRWTMELWELATRFCPRVAMENPVGTLPMKATQYVQPWQFGHGEAKKTGLWLHGLPKLQPTNILPLPGSGRWENQTPSGQNKLGPSTDRWKIRSKTYEGIASAMASQWGKQLADQGSA